MYEVCIFLSRKDAHNSVLGCSTYTSSVLLRKQRQQRQQQQQNHSCRKLEFYDGNFIKTHILNVQKRQISCTSRAHCSVRGSGTSTSASATGSETIDEFRAREEQREKDFANQQTEKEQTDQESAAEDEAKRAKIDTIRKRILEAALTHVLTLGWTRQAIVQGAEEVGLPSVVHGMFPEGGFALVSYFYGKCNDELVRRLQAETQNGEKQVDDPLDFLVRAVRMRLEMIAHYKGQWPQAMALIALPQNASTALAQVLTLVDDICYYSGDRSVDFGWYTRRIGLATIMKMTELYMLQDTSPQHANTWEFLKNRMDEAVQLQMMLAQTENMTHSFQRSFNSAFVTARNILGLGYDRK